MSKKVSVIMGGTSSEREVSLISGETVAQALKNAGYQVGTIDMGKNIFGLIDSLDPQPDAVFNALHGKYGEDGCVQGVLEVMQIPYTHSGVLASALAMQKPMAKTLFKSIGIPCAQHVIADRDTVLSDSLMEKPYVLKPLNQGSSIGIQIIEEDSQLSALIQKEWPYGENVMVEKYIPGREITVAVMGNRALAVTELITKNKFYNYEAKYTNGRATHIIPAPLPKLIYETALEQALAAHNVLGCQGVTRTDFRYNDTESDPGTLWILEINTQPGMTPFSLLPEQAAYVGIDFGSLVSWMVENASCGC